MTRAAAALGLVLLTGCAAARITPSPGGPVVTAIAIGTARVMTCDDGNGAVTMGSADAALLGSCVVVQGGALSPAVVDIAATVASAVATYLTAGAAW